MNYEYLAMLDIQSSSEILKRKKPGRDDSLQPFKIEYGLCENLQTQNTNSLQTPLIYLQ